ncbi:hypothetical protein DXG01_003863 [Tephrocybe rancida]|nr:hypothetical protein DXG01_003863 [Tephrocybe rancida]
MPKVAEYQMRIPNGDLHLAAEYLERVASSNAEDVGRAAELLKKVKASLQAKIMFDAERAPKSHEAGDVTADSLGDDLSGKFSTQANGVSPVFNISTPHTFAASVASSPAGPSTWRTSDFMTPSGPATSSQRPQRIKNRTPEELEIIDKTSERLSARLASDHALALSPDVDTPFHDTLDALHRLLPYHVFLQPQEDLDLLTSNAKGKAKAKQMELKEEIRETKFALECHRRRDALVGRFRDIQTRQGKRSAPDDQAILITSLVLDVERSETTVLGNELRSVRAEQERKEREKRLASQSARPAYYGPAPTTTTAVPPQYYRGYPYAYTQVYGAPTQASSTTTFSVSPTPALPASTQTAIPVQLPVASLPALHALGIVPIPATSLPAAGHPQPAAVLRGSTSNGTMLSLEINVSSLQSAQMSGLAMVLNSLMSKSGNANSSSPDTQSSVAGGTETA